MSGWWGGRGAVVAVVGAVGVAVVAVAVGAVVVVAAASVGGVVLQGVRERGENGEERTSGGGR